MCITNKLKKLYFTDQNEKKNLPRIPITRDTKLFGNNKFVQRTK